MGYFGILTIRNIRSTQQRINARIRQRDIQSRKILFLQVIITIACSLPLGLSQLITTITSIWEKDSSHLTIENLIGHHLVYANCSISFYLYTISGSQFRLEIRQTLNRFSMFLCNRRVLERRQIGTILPPISPNRTVPRL